MSKIGTTGLKSRCRQGFAISRCSGGESGTCFFQLLVAASSPWLVAAPPHPSGLAASDPLLCLHLAFSPPGCVR